MVASPESSTVAPTDSIQPVDVVGPVGSALDAENVECPGRVGEARVAA